MMELSPVVEQNAPQEEPNNCRFHDEGGAHDKGSAQDEGGGHDEGAADDERSAHDNGGAHDRKRAHSDGSVDVRAYRNTTMVV